MYMLVRGCIDQLGYYGTPAVAHLGDDDLVYGAVSRELVKGGLLTIVPSLQLWISLFRTFGHNVSSGAIGEVWDALLGAALVGQVTCIPVRFHCDADRFDTLSRCDRDRIYAVVGYRAKDGFAAIEWKLMFKDAIRGVDAFAAAEQEGDERI